MLRSIQQRVIHRGRWKIIVRSVTYHPIVTTAVLFLLLLPFSHLGKSLMDSYLPWSGTVVSKGLDYDFLGGESDSYVMIQDAHGARTKRYVTDLTQATTLVGSYVEKKRGLGEKPLPAGRHDPHKLVRVAD